MKELPKRFKFGRTFRVKLKNNNVSMSFLNIWFCKYGLKALEYGKLCTFHTNAIVRLLKRNFKKELNYIFNIEFNTPITKKPREVRMGKGKGGRDHWEANVRKGQIVLEIGGEIPVDKLFRVLLLIQQKLPFKTKIIKLIY